MTNHTAIMQRAISLALRGKGRVHPNPLVGCVLVKNGRIVGEGFHSHFGGPHAEQIALQKAGKKARGATVYLNLEPCAHWGKTPPCAPALIKAGVKKLFVALKDPNPKVNGKGLSMLRRAGVQVHVGLEAASASHINRAFVTWMTKKRPFVILKMAMTLDGKIASRTGASKWISSPASRRLVHRFRAQSDAVLIGAGTAIKDNPELSSHGQGRNPVRIVLDPHLKTPFSLKLYKPSRQPTWLVTAAKVSPNRLNRFEKSGHKILRQSLKYGRFETIKFLNLISKMNISQLLVEGGGDTAWGLISSKCVDEVLVFMTPKILGGRDAKTPVEGLGFAQPDQALSLKSMSVVRVGSDFLIKGVL